MTPVKVYVGCKNIYINGSCKKFKTKTKILTVLTHFYSLE